MASFVNQTIVELVDYASAIKAEWNGKEPGRLEERADKAHQLIVELGQAMAIYEELENE